MRFLKYKLQRYMVENPVNQSNPTHVKVEEVIRSSFGFKIIIKIVFIALRIA